MYRKRSTNWKEERYDKVEKWEIRILEAEEKHKNRWIGRIRDNRTAERLWKRIGVGKQEEEGKNKRGGVCVVERRRDCTKEGSNCEKQIRREGKNQIRKRDYRTRIYEHIFFLCVNLQKGGNCSIRTKAYSRNRYIRTAHEWHESLQGMNTMHNIITNEAETKWEGIIKRSKTETIIEKTCSEWWKKTWRLKKKNIRSVISKNVVSQTINQRQQLNDLIIREPLNNEGHNRP